MRCGEEFPIPGGGGDPYQCNPNSAAPCCKLDIGYCGGASTFCSCGDLCIDYSDRRLGEESKYSDNFLAPSDSSDSSDSFDWTDWTPETRTHHQQMVTSNHGPRHLASSKEPGVSLSTLSSPVGICLNTFTNNKNGQMHRPLNIDLCTSNQMQGWELTDENYIRNMFWPDHCIAVDKDDLANLVGADVYLKPCKDSNYVNLVWKVPNHEQQVSLTQSPLALTKTRIRATTRLTLFHSIRILTFFARRSCSTQ